MINLENINFGSQVAESEKEYLINYFVETVEWKELYKDEIDIILGAKGSGKSALYMILQNKADDLKKEKGIFVVNAEKPTGQTLFSKMLDNNLLEHGRDYILFWKLYICVIISNSIKNDYGFINSNLMKQLKKYDLIQNDGLDGIFTSVLNVTKKLLQNIKSVEYTSLKVETHNPLESKVNFNKIEINDWLKELNDLLKKQESSFWILCDRLDSTFENAANASELESNIIRSLFKTYLDIGEFSQIKLKIFMRDDIWARIINEKGFSEASHITKAATIKWDQSALMNLIISRMLNNNEILGELNITKSEVLRDYDKQQSIFYRILPEQVDKGSKKPKTFDWICSRIEDGNKIITPRELIHFFIEIKKQQIKLNKMGKTNKDDSRIFTPDAIRNSVLNVSKDKLEKTLYSEYPNLKQYIEKLEQEKAEMKLDYLSRIWRNSEEEAENICNELIKIGFFEKNKKGDYYKIPFLYRQPLKIKQGKPM